MQGERLVALGVVRYIAKPPTTMPHMGSITRPLDPL